jgi:hypothetical protein
MPAMVLFVSEVPFSHNCPRWRFSRNVVTTTARPNPWASFFYACLSSWVRGRQETHSSNSRVLFRKKTAVELPQITSTLSEWVLRERMWWIAFAQHVFYFYYFYFFSFFPFSSTSYNLCYSSTHLSPIYICLKMILGWNVVLLNILSF